MARIPELTEIRKLRKEIDYSQRKFAKLCDIQPSYLNAIENGNSDPSYKVLVRIFKKLDELKQKHLDQLTTAGKICTKTIISAKKTDYAEEILKQMHSKDISQIPVVDSHGCVGLVTENSFVQYVREHGAEKFATARARDVLETPPPTIDVDEKITNELLELLDNARCILVTDKGRLYGILTKIDALRGLMKK